MTDCDKEIGARIKALRERAGLTQAQVAERLQMKRETFNTIENGKRALKAQDICLLAEQLGTTTDYILNGDYGTYRKSATDSFAAIAKEYAEEAIAITRTEDKILCLLQGILHALIAIAAE